MRVADVIQRNRQVLEDIVSRLIPRGQPHALLDFPDHSNVGDTAIWMGEIKLLEKLTGVRPPYVSTAVNFDEQAMRAALPEGPILLHGGGNFGDLYPRHQNFRERILSTFPERRIIQLPQSIQYRDPSQIGATAAAIEKHRDFHFCVRDHRSLELAGTRFECHVYLTPDAAFALGPLERIGRPTHDVLLLLRKDIEKVERDTNAFAALANSRRADWPSARRGFRAAAAGKAALKLLASGNARTSSRRLVFYDCLAEERLRRGRELLSSGKRVVTDRLHGHILCLLLGLPHVTLDNDYGKIRAYRSAWTEGSDQVWKASDPAEAVAMLRRAEAAAP